MNAMKELNDAIIEINRIIGASKTDEASFYRVQDQMKKLQVGFDHYGNRQVSEEMVPWAKAINSRVQAELTAQAAANFKRGQQKAAARLEALRAILPSLAAKAAIELGVEARAILKAKESDHA